MPPTKTSKSAIATAVAAIMGRVHVQATGHNDHHKYSYLSDLDLVKTLANEMSAEGLVLLPAEVGYVQDDDHTHGVFHFELLHVSGESRTIAVMGSGKDKQDKGPYKAMTGARKYALRLIFMIGTDTDPEREDVKGAKPEKAPEHPGYPQGRKETPNESRARQETHDPSWDADQGRFFARLKTLGVDFVILGEFLDSKGYGRPSTIAQDRRDKMVGDLERSIVASEHGGELVGWVGEFFKYETEVKS